MRRCDPLLPLMMTHCIPNLPLLILNIVLRKGVHDELTATFALVQLVGMKSARVQNYCARVDAERISMQSVVFLLALGARSDLLICRPLVDLDHA